MNEPMSDERLAEIRRMAGEVWCRHYNTAEHGRAKRELLAEVDRLRAASAVLDQVEEWAQTDAWADLTGYASARKDVLGIIREKRVKR